MMFRNEINYEKITKREVHNVVCRKFNEKWVVVGFVSTIGVVSGIGDSESEAKRNLIYNLHNLYHSQ